MIGLDTNVLVRYFTQDDPIQSPRAIELIEHRLDEDNPGFVSVVAMVTSAILDLPTGATVVCAFGLILLVLAIATRLAGRAAPA